MQTIIRHTVLALLILAIATLSPGLARAQIFTAEEVQKLKLLLQYVRVDNKDLNGLAGPHVIFEHANVHIRSGSDATDDRIGGEPSGWGNLIIGYNEVSPNMANPAEARRGSHNLDVCFINSWPVLGFSLGAPRSSVASGAGLEPGAPRGRALAQDLRNGHLVIGPGHTYISVGGLVAGEQSTILGDYASVSGGRNNAARAAWSSVSGGEANRASGAAASVSGGAVNEAVGNHSNISGGMHNTAAGQNASISGGGYNTASGSGASVSGG